LRKSLEGYLGKEMPEVYSLVAAVPYSPVDVDLAILSRGEWDALSDRFRFWFLPGGPGEAKPSCYVMIRKYDKEQGVLACVHITANLGHSGEDESLFTVGLLCNDDVRARAMLGVFLAVPPVFHRRSEVRLVEKRWRSDPETLLRYAANVYSALAAAANPGGATYSLKFEPAEDIMKELRLDERWDSDIEGDKDHKA